MKMDIVFEELSYSITTGHQDSLVIPDFNLKIVSRAAP